MARKDLGGLLLEAVDEYVRDVMGEGVREAFYGFFEEKFHLSKESIPNRLDEFVVVLSETFGMTGGAVTGRGVAKRLYAKLGLKFIEKPGYTLLDYVKEAEDKSAAGISPSPHSGTRTAKVI